MKHRNHALKSNRFDNQTQNVQSLDQIVSDLAETNKNGMHLIGNVAAKKKRKNTMISLDCKCGNPLYTVERSVTCEDNLFASIQMITWWKHLVNRVEMTNGFCNI